MANKETCALLCVDMQNDFCLPSSPLCVAGAKGCLPRVVQAVDIARSKGIPVIWVIREHHESGVDVEHTRAHLFQNGGQGSTVPGTSGAALVEPLAVQPGELVVVKKRFSGFLHTHLDLVLRRMGVRRVVVCGVQTPNCIRATAVDALGHDYVAEVLADATGSKSDAVQESNLEDMRCMGIKTPTVDDWAAGLA